MIDPLSIAAAGTAVGALEDVFSGGETSSKTSGTKKKDVNFDQLLSQQQSVAGGFSADQALELIGANVTVKGTNGALVTGNVERVELQPNGVSLRVQGHDYMNDQIVKVNQTA